ncbi:MAG: glycosyl hydrolase family 18 protein [bacterium]
MKSFVFITIFILIFPCVSRAQTSASPQALLYVQNSTRAINSLREHISSVDIVAPQTYVTNSKGKLMGKPNKEILSIAQTAGAHIMPLVSNQGFNQKKIDEFLKDTNAQNALLASLVTEAQTQKYIGYQYDFEHIAVSDRDVYSAFIAKSATYFHGNNLQLSVAIAPIHSENPNDFGPGSWQNWTGAFDYPAIGASADFVSVMAYDDSNSVGPTASLPWVTQVANYTLAHIPANKVSFGIPFYAWVRNTATGKRVEITGYPVLGSIIDNGTYIDKGWSDTLGVPWITFKAKGKHGKVLTAWYEDAQSFQKKINLIKTNNMRGYSAWAIGQEDPKIWNVIAQTRSSDAQVAVK